MRTSRMEAFSDGVFAIAITLLILEIRVPEETTDLGRALIDLWPSYLAYAISFLLIGLVWVNHHTMVDRIRRVDRMLLLLNTLLLANVSALPFTTAVMARAISAGHGQRVAVAVYGAWLVVGGVFFNAFWLWAVYRPGLLDAAASRRWTGAATVQFLLGPVLYAVGTVVAVFAWQVALIMFAALIVAYWLPIGRGRSPRIADSATASSTDNPPRPG